MSVRIITDSASDITQAQAQALGIDVLPLKTIFGSEEYRDGVDISAEEFYTKLAASSVLPTTSQLSPFDFEEKYRAAVEKGDEVVCIVVSSRLSGCFQSANIAAEEFPGKVHVVDSLSVAIGERCLVDVALKARDEGKSAGEIKALLDEIKQHLRLFALVDTLEYLKKGGRVSPTAALAGTLLGIKPVIAVENGEVAILGKARGLKNGNNMLVELVKKGGGINFQLPAHVAYTGLSSDPLKAFLTDSADLYGGRADEVPIHTIGSTIGTHAGPGAYALAYFANS